MNSDLKALRNLYSDKIAVNNAFINDTNISLKAKGLVLVMLTLPTDFRITEKALAEYTGEGIKSVRSGLKELEQAGYLRRYQLRDNGCYGEMIYELPQNIVMLLEDEKVQEGWI